MSDASFITDLPLWLLGLVVSTAVVLMTRCWTFTFLGRKVRRISWYVTTAVEEENIQLKIGKGTKIQP